MKSVNVYFPFNCLCCAVDSTAPSDAFTRFAICGPFEGLDLFMLSSFGLGSEDDVTAVVACEGAVEGVALDDSDETVLVVSLCRVSLTGDLGVGSSRPPAESFVFFFLRRLPKVGIGAETCGSRRSGESGGSPYWPGM